MEGNAPSAPAGGAVEGGQGAVAPATAPANAKISLLAKLRQMQGKDLPAPQADLAPAEAPAADGGAVAAESSADATAGEGAGEAAPEAKADEAPAPEQAKATAYEHRIAQAMLKAQRAERDALNHKRAADSASKELAELRSTLEALKSDPVKALAHAGTDPAALAQMMLDGKIQAKDLPPKLELPPEVQELVEQGKQAKARAEQEARDAEAAAVRAQNVELIKQAVDASVSEYPALSALPPEMVLDAYERATKKNRGIEPPFSEVAKQLQATVVADLSYFLKSDGVMKAFLTSADPDVRAAVAKAFGFDQPQTTRNAEPKREGAKQTPQPAAEKTVAAETATVTNRNVTSVPGRDSRAKSSSAELVAKIRREVQKLG